MRFAFRLALHLVVLTAFSPLLKAQTDFNVRLWQSEDGLPNNIVQAIAQTDDGYLWIGTREGLARFDGDQFHVVDLLPHSSQPSVICLLGSRDGSLWIGTEYAGIFHLSGGTLNRCALAGGDFNFDVYEIQENRDGVVWFGTSRGILYWADGRLELKNGYKNVQPRFCTDNRTNVWVLENGLKRLDSNTTTNYPIQLGTLPSRARSLYCDKDGVFWAGTEIGSANALLRIKNGEVSSFERNPGPEGFVSVLFKDSTGVLWVGSYTGLSRLEDNRLSNFTTSGGSSYRIYSIFEDRENNIWVGSEEGLTRMVPKKFRTITKADGLSLNAVVSLCPSRDGGVWISSWGGGINHYVNGKFDYLSTTNGLKSNYVMALTETRDGSLWAGSDFGGPLQRIQDGRVTVYDRAHGFIVRPDNATVALCESSNGVLWIGNRDGLQSWNGAGFTRFTTRNGLCNNTINALCEGAEGELWIGTDEGLMRLQDGKFKNFGAQDPRLKTIILSIYEDAQRNVWIGSKGRGLFMLHDEAVDEFTSDRGLYSDFIYSILEDNHSNLWLNSSRGIFRVNKLQVEAVADGREAIISSIRYGKADGILASSQFRNVTQPAACQDTHGRFWFRTTQGAVTVDPEIIKFNHQPPPVVLQSIIADNKPVSLDQFGFNTRNSILIPPGHGELEIQYAALSFTEPEKNMYRYKLVGVDADWVNAGNIRLIKYDNLRPRHYRFEVTACNNEGVWNPRGQSVDLILEPHFWQTWWFFSLCGLVVVAVVSGTARYLTQRRMQMKLTQLEQQRALERERTRIARDVHDELGAKLTRISFQGGIAACSLNDPVEAQKHIEQMAAAAREAVSSLHEIIWAADPRNDSLEGLVGHVSHYAEEFFNACGIRCEVMTPENIPACHISAGLRHNLFLAIKEAINNAAKHARATRVLVQLFIRENKLEVTISDNGGGFKIELASEGPTAKLLPTRHHGLANMRERLAKIHGLCEISSDDGKGTTVYFVIPLNYEANH